MVPLGSSGKGFLPLSPHKHPSRKAVELSESGHVHSILRPTTWTETEQPTVLIKIALNPSEWTTRCFLRMRKLKPSAEPMMKYLQCIRQWVEGVNRETADLDRFDQGSWKRSETRWRSQAERGGSCFVFGRKLSSWALSTVCWWIVLAGADAQL